MYGRIDYSFYYLPETSKPIIHFQRFDSYSKAHKIIESLIKFKAKHIKVKLLTKEEYECSVKQ